MTSNSTATLSVRQQYLLQQMGVDLWQQRSVSPVSADTGTDTQTETPTPTVASELSIAPEQPALAEADQSAGWQAAFQGDRSSNFWLIYEIAGPQHESQTLQKTLQEAIVFALGTVAQEACLVALTKDAAAAAKSLTGVLQTAMQSSQPAVIFVMGLGAAQSLLSCDKTMSELRQEQYRLSGGQTSLKVSHGLAELLQEPAKKAELWLDLQQAMQLDL